MVHWEDIVTEKKQRQQAAIPPEWLIPSDSLPPSSQLDVSSYAESCSLLSDKDKIITNSSIDELLSSLASGHWSSVEVTTSFYKRAIIAHQLTNCLTEIFVETALARAEELDEYLKIHGKPIGPLHGLPVSLKDQINIKDIESCMGYVSWIGVYPEKDAVLVDILKTLGAVPFVKTNIPQTLMWPETFNHVFGRTTNPYNRSLTSGGSSGGEGALIALKGSPLGVGSDIGGSVRIPSAFCGLYGFRPSYNRIPYAGCVNSGEGQDSVLSVLGPLTRSVSGIKAFMETVISEKPWTKDPLAIRKPWSQDEYDLNEHGGKGQKLCFAILWDDEIIRPLPPVLRALGIAKAALEKAGHSVVDWKPYKHGELMDCLYGIWDAGSDEDFAAVAKITGEPVITSMSPLDDSASTEFRPSEESTTAFKLWQIQKKKRDLREEYLDAWEATKGITGTARPVDAVLSPSAAWPAPPHGKNIGISYTGIWNVLDYPALVIPVTTVDQELDVKHERTQFHSEKDQAHYDNYNPNTYTNAPVAIQVVGRTLEEEAVIAMSEIVDAALKASA